MRIYHHSNIHASFAVCIRDSPIIRRTIIIPITVILSDAIFSLVVARLIVLSDSHANGERNKIFNNGKLHATIVNTILTQIHCKIALCDIANHATIGF
jgi:hypothetical protein